MAQENRSIKVNPERASPALSLIPRSPVQRDDRFLARPIHIQTSRSPKNVQARNKQTITQIQGASMMKRMTELQEGTANSRH